MKTPQQRAEEKAMEIIDSMFFELLTVENDALLEAFTSEFTALYARNDALEEGLRSIAGKYHAEEEAESDCPVCIASQLLTTTDQKA